MKKTISIILSLLMIIGLAVSSSADIVKEGKCGPGVSYKLSSDGTLEISGSGKMDDYSGNSVFADNTTINKVIIKSGVSSIGEETFQNCKNIVSIDIPDTVTEIGEYAFAGCHSLKEIELPPALTEIKFATFEFCLSLEYIKIPDSVTMIGGWAFDTCAELKSVYIPDSVKSIGELAFMDCPKLTSLFIPRSVVFVDRDGIKKSSIKDIYYQGSKEEWNRVDTINGNDEFAGVTIHFNCIGVPGDLDADGKITASDARFTLRAAVNLETFSDAQKQSADLDGNGRITSADARIILRRAVGLE